MWVTGRAAADSESAAPVARAGRGPAAAEHSPHWQAMWVAVWWTGDAQVMASTVGLLGRSGVAVLLGIDGRVRDVSVDGRGARHRLHPRQIRGHGQRQRALR